MYDWRGGQVSGRENDRPSARSALTVSPPADWEDAREQLGIGAIHPVREGDSSARRADHASALHAPVPGFGRDGGRWKFDRR